MRIMPDEKKMTAAEAKATLDREDQVRRERCSQKIEKALQEENCELAVSMLILPQGNFPQIQVVAKR
jgi:oligoendopeptidase F